MDRNYGRISAWVAKGGWGMVAVEDDCGAVENLWWHISSFKVKPKVELVVGQQVSFTIRGFKSGKHRTAENIEFV